MTERALGTMKESQKSRETKKRIGRKEFQFCPKLPRRGMRH
jgi:hypothetical protein